MIPVQRDDRDNITILRIKGDLSFENTVWLRVNSTICSNRIESVSYSTCLKVNMISSYTVGVFVAIARDLNDRQGDLKFFNLQKRVIQTFQATRIDSILQTFKPNKKRSKRLGGE